MEGELAEDVTSDPAPAAVVAPLSAVRVLFSTDRKAAEYDIIVATAVECLRDGDWPRDQLALRIQRVWPGSKIVQTSIDAALAAAEVANLMVQSHGLFRLTEAGRREIDASRGWAETAYQRIAEIGSK